MARRRSLSVGVLIAVLAVGCGSSTPTVADPTETLTAVMVTPSSPTSPTRAPSPTPTATATTAPSPTDTPSPSTTPTLKPVPPPALVTMEDNGRTFRLRLGDHLVVRLGEEGMTWSDLESSSANVMVVERRFLVDPGHREWDVTAIRKGDAVLSSVGDLPCRIEVPPCLAPSVLWEVRIIVR